MQPVLKSRGKKSRVKSRDGQAPSPNLRASRALSPLSGAWCCLVRGRAVCRLRVVQTQVPGSLPSPDLHGEQTGSSGSQASLWGEITPSYFRLRAAGWLGGLGSSAARLGSIPVGLCGAGSAELCLQDACSASPAPTCSVGTHKKHLQRRVGVILIPQRASQTRLSFIWDSRVKLMGYLCCSGIWELLNFGSCV